MKTRELLTSGLIAILCGAAGAALWMSGTRGIPLASRAAAQTAPQTVTAQRFIVTDPAGRQQAILGSVGGEPSLVLIDHYNKPVASLIVTSANEPGVTLYDDQGRLRASLLVHADGDVALSLNGADGKSTAGLSLGSHGEPRLVMKDARGASMVELPIPAKSATKSAKQ